MKKVVINVIKDVRSRIAGINIVLLLYSHSQPPVAANPLIKHTVIIINLLQNEIFTSLFKVTFQLLRECSINLNRIDSAHTSRFANT